MSDVFLQRKFAEPLSMSVISSMLEDSRGCYRMHRVDWQQSLLSADKKRLLCHFRGPDAESVRIALRQLDADMRIHWSGTIHDAPGKTSDDILKANVVVLRSFDAPADLDELQAREDAHIHCLDNHRVTFMRTFLSRDKHNMACLYQAPDAESVRIAQREATMPFDQVWTFQRLTPDSIQ